MSAAVSGSATSQNVEEISSRDVAPTFRSTVNLVMVPVVVRDAKGNTIGNLRREDFRVFDNGKPQIIKHFSAESAVRRAARAKAATPAETSIAGASPATTIPRRFVAYVFDDLHLDTGDLIQARQAAIRQLSSLRPEDRAALYTTSGRHVVEFTDDLAKVREGLLRLMTQPRFHQCPDLGPYWAFLIQQEGFQGPASSAAKLEFDKCKSVDISPSAAVGGGSSRDMAFRSMVDTVLAESDREVARSLALLREVIRRMAALPGERTVVTVSPGFLARQRQEELESIIDRAVRARVAVNTLDARGVYTLAAFDVERITVPSAAGMMYMSQEASVQQDVLESLADGTGGTFFHSNNDLNEGFRRTVAVPEYSYMLGFTPSASGGDLYHKLKVKVEGKRNLSIQARRGYFVAKTPADPSEAARQQIENAMFSSDEIHELPIQVGTEVSRKRGGEAALKVAVHLDLKQLPLRKVGDRNNGDLELYAAVFDRNGNYLSGKGKKVELRLRDETLARLTSGANLNMQFGLHPGSYMVRVVVREAEGQQMAAANKAVQIP